MHIGIKESDCNIGRALMLKTKLIFTVSMLALFVAGAARADLASTSYIQNMTYSGRWSDQSSTDTYVNQIPNVEATISIAQYYAGEAAGEVLNTVDQSVGIALADKQDSINPTQNCENVEGELKCTDKDPADYIKQGVVSVDKDGKVVPAKIQVEGEGPFVDNILVAEDGTVKVSKGNIKGNDTVVVATQNGLTSLELKPSFSGVVDGEHMGNVVNGISVTSEYIEVQTADAAMMPTESNYVGDVVTVQTVGTANLPVYVNDKVVTPVTGTAIPIGGATVGSQGWATIWVE